MEDFDREQGSKNCDHMFQYAVNIGGQTCCSHCRQPMDLKVMALKHIEYCKAEIAAKEGRPVDGR